MGTTSWTDSTSSKLLYKWVTTFPLILLYWVFWEVEKRNLLYVPRRIFARFDNAVLMIVTKSTLTV